MTAPWMPPLPSIDRDAGWHMLYTTDQMRRAQADAARAALEQAAKVCQNERFVYSDEEWRIRCELADAIRVMAKDIE